MQKPHHTPPHTPYKPPAPLKYLWAAVAASVLWAFISIPIKALQDLHYGLYETLLGRVSCSVVLLFLYMVIIKRDDIFRDIFIFRHFTLKQQIKFSSALLASGIALFSNWIGFLYIIEHHGVKGGAFNYLIAPIITAFLGFIILREAVSMYKIVGLLFACVAILITGHGSFENILPVLFCAGSFSIYFILQKFLPKISRVTIFFCQLLIVFALALPLAFEVFHMDGLPTQVAFWANCAVIGSLFTILPLTLNLFALIKVPASTMAVLMYLSPIISFILSIVIYHEAISREETAAYAILLFSILIFNYERIMYAIKHRKKKTYTKQLP